MSKHTWGSFEHPKHGTVHYAEARTENPRIRLELRLEEFGWEAFVYCPLEDRAGRVVELLLLRRQAIATGRIDIARTFAEALWAEEERAGGLTAIRELWIRRYGTASERVELAARDKRRAHEAAARNAQERADRKNGKRFEPKGQFRRRPDAKA